MNEISKTRKQLRFRMYFWLMDACLIFAGIGLAEHLLDNVLGVEFDPDAPLYKWLGVIVVTFNFLVPFFLVVAKFMRDEYAELLWQRTAVAFAYAFAVVPLLLLAAVSIDIATSPTGQPRSFLSLLGEGGIDAGEFMMQIWTAAMLMFVGMFQLLRWLDSRS